VDEQLMLMLLLLSPVDTHGGETEAGRSRLPSCCCGSPPRRSSPSLIRYLPGSSRQERQGRRPGARRKGVAAGSHRRTPPATAASQPRNPSPGGSSCPLRVRRHRRRRSVRTRDATCRAAPRPRPPATGGRRPAGRRQVGISVRLPSGPPSEREAARSVSSDPLPFFSDPRSPVPRRRWRCEGPGRFAAGIGRCPP
jgi:hypothetical protein